MIESTFSRLRRERPTGRLNRARTPIERCTRAQDLTSGLSRLPKEGPSEYPSACFRSILTNQVPGQLDQNGSFDWLARSSLPQKERFFGKVTDPPLKAQNIGRFRSSPPLTGDRTHPAKKKQYILTSFPYLYQTSLANMVISTLNLLLPYCRNSPRIMNKRP